MEFLDIGFPFVKECISLIGALIISFGVIRAVYHLILGCIYKNYSVNYVRLQLGNSVVLGLEFMVAGDIIGSLVKPDYYNLGLLAIVIALRTVLSYFLNVEMASLTPGQQKGLKS